MIRLSAKIDLGQDQVHMKDLRDARRQAATVKALLYRLFNPNPDRRWEIQILADEVGMGKTYVGLATAFSVLEAMQKGHEIDDLKDCYQKILIITPQNSALLDKWRSEVGEFIRRCIKPGYQEEVSKWFRIPRKPVDRLDDLVGEIRRGGNASKVIVISSGMFSGDKLRHYDIKRRQMLGVLFRYWGSRFKKENRERLLRGAPGNWTKNPSELDRFSESERKNLPFNDHELLCAVLDFNKERLDELLDECKEISARHVRNRSARFDIVEKKLTEIYRSVLSDLIGRSFPLVIVDEAHNWKNGPTSNTHGYKKFIDLIVSRTRRAILMTATPFQLRPIEMLDILRIGEELKPATTREGSARRTARLKELREDAIRPVLNNATESSRQFTRSWSKLSPTLDKEIIERAWNDPGMVEARDELQKIAARHGSVRKNEIEHIIDPMVQNLDPSIRQLIRQGMYLYVYNADLSHELGRVVIRHRRRAEHRLFRVGSEFNSKSEIDNTRPDCHLLHAASGIDVRGESELPHYLLMRCVSEMKKGRGKSSLGSVLTGCYSTLTHSAEGRAVKNSLAQSEVGEVYLDLLLKMVSDEKDPQHPKVREVVEYTVKNWQAGEKTLIFCFRTNTARRLHDIIDQRIHEEVSKRRMKCLGGSRALKSLRNRLSGRDRDLVVLGLDRVLWSALWANHRGAKSLRPEDLKLQSGELERLAELGLRYGVKLCDDKIDRVFLNRATEHIIAHRLINNCDNDDWLNNLLHRMSDEDWIRNPYGFMSTALDDEAGEEAAQFDEVGVHSVYDHQSEPDRIKVKSLALKLQSRRERAIQQGQTSVFDVYFEGPSLWLGADPVKIWHSREDTSGHKSKIEKINRFLWQLTLEHGSFNWEDRLRIFQAMRRVLLRESVFVRILPDKKDRDETGWGELLVRRFFSPLPGQSEGMVDRICVFLDALRSANGRYRESGSARYMLLDSTRLRDQQNVALVTGKTEAQTRSRIFKGFNTPLLPEVLICTSVGQEGIDLHLHCRHVVHYDLAWNPAVLEQRTGRVDRIGSKTFRERSSNGGGKSTFLEIGVPYLAGTYDERMYEELRLRSQIFEVLTGGDLISDNADGHDDQPDAEGRESGHRFVPLPESMLRDLRVTLRVWTENGR